MKRIITALILSVICLTLSAAEFTDPYFPDLKVTYPDSMQIRYQAASDSVIDRAWFSNADASATISMHLVLFPQDVKYNARQEAKTQPESRLFNINGFRQIDADSTDSRWTKSYTYQFDYRGQTAYCRTYRKATSLKQGTGMIMFKAYSFVNDFTFADEIVGSASGMSFWDKYTNFRYAPQILIGLFIFLLPYLIGWLPLRIVAGTHSEAVGFGAIGVSLLALIICLVTFLYLGVWQTILQLVMWVGGIGVGMQKRGISGKGGSEDSDADPGSATYINQDLGI